MGDKGGTGAPYNIEILRHPMTPKVDEKGEPLSKLVPYAPHENPCLLCPGKCCHLVVKVSIPDAIHYCRTLGVPFFSGLDLTRSLDEKRGILLERDKRFVPENEGWPGRVEIMLRRHENGRCHGLMDLGGYERCGVYGARPSFCRTYPVSWNSDVAQGGPPAVICPIPYALSPTVEAGYIADIKESIERWALHDALIDEWNAAADQPRTIEAFLAYVLPKAGQKLGLSIDGIMTEGDHSQRLYDAMIETRVMPRSPFESFVKAPRIYAGLAASKKKL